ncbi:pilin [uncultured Microbulbifer sp.]|uniref:pilin n=1 Tax=uncultured Microbulbifer sp. TaxID=348147 RepID=UPI00260F0125|nr:pilin [uncultured Microbulbifer sp.]
MKKQQGFTLIELMIVVAIIGILAAVALPAYQDYTIRSKMSEVILQAGAHKNSVVEYYQSQGKLPTTLAAAGVSSVVPSPYIGSVQMTASNSALVYGVTIDSQSGNVQLAPTVSNGSLTWKCSGTIDSKYLPANCR